MAKKLNSKHKQGHDCFCEMRARGNDPRKSTVVIHYPNSALRRLWSRRSRHKVLVY